MSMYNLWGYSDNYSMKSGSLWNYYRDETSDDENENDHNNKLNYNKTITSKSLKYKTKIIWKTPDDENELNTEAVIPLKYLSNFWKSLDLPLINYEIDFDLSWSRYCIISEILRAFEAVPNPNPARYRVTSQAASVMSQINNAKVYVPVVILSINDNTKFLENINQGFKCRSETTTQLETII